MFIVQLKEIFVCWWLLFNTLLLSGDAILVLLQSFNCWKNPSGSRMKKRFFKTFGSIVGRNFFDVDWTEWILLLLPLNWNNQSRENIRAVELHRNIGGSKTASFLWPVILMISLFWTRELFNCLTTVCFTSSVIFLFTAANGELFFIVLIILFMQLIPNRVILSTKYCSVVCR